ncbi:hypothetical protein [Actinoplanes sp. NPDC026619]|uniref:hypothetical protein n=1 Tax=Actinoplanes sp. NPDC026619 TaxID=3155798 RepID=UPI0033FB024E
MRMPVTEPSPDRETSSPAPPMNPLDLGAATAALAATVTQVGRSAPGDIRVSPAELLEALVLLRRAQSELAGFEPILIAAARAAGVSWQAIAPALGVASRQAAERRYLRSTASPTEQPGATRDARVQAERDRRAGDRAVTRWANDHTADLRRLAGQITALADLDDAADQALAQLHNALGEPDASTLPALLAAVQRHLRRHPGLTGQIDAVTAHTDQIRKHPARQHGIGPQEHGGNGSD